VLDAWSPTPEGASEPSLPDHERLQAPSILDAVRMLVNLVEDDEPGSVLPPGVYGAFSYELVDRWEELPPRPADPFDEPDIDVVLALDAILFDHVAGHVHVVTRSLARSEDALADERHARFVRALTLADGAERLENEPPLPTVSDHPATADVTDEQFLASVDKCLDHIARGDVFQVVLSRGLAMESKADPLAVYRVLRQQNPSPYMFHVDLAEGVLLGASPETCVKVDGRRLEIRPIAGTAPRGFAEECSSGEIDPELDSRLAIGLLLDAKEQAEHAMLVDLARNDVARVSIPGTRRVAEPFTIEKYSHVQHLVSGVSGELRPELDALHAYRAAANMGTLTGAPKLRAMELIRETEPHARGFYGGAVGYFLQDGTFDSCIVIRSLRYRPGGTYTTRAGAGIVADSVAERELEETAHKARACRQAVAIAEACG
jgi:anthranilate synthase component 1